MKIKVKNFLVVAGDKVKLDKWPTVSHSLFDSKKQYHEVLNEHVKQLSELQQLHYASSRFALLLIFQGMDDHGGFTLPDVTPLVNRDGFAGGQIIYMASRLSDSLVS